MTHVTTEKLDRRQTEKSSAKINNAKSSSATNNLTTIKNTHENNTISTECQEP